MYALNLKQFCTRRSFFPSISWENALSYVGLRPACVDKTDYQIELNARNDSLTLGAIRSTGLTTSRALAEFAAKKLLGCGSDDEYVRKDVTMPAPEILSNGKLKVGKYEFTPCHPLCRIGNFQK